MRATPVYRSIERPSRILGLELFDFFVWISSFTFWSAGRGYAVAISGLVWIALFALRYRKPAGYLQTLARYYALRVLCGNVFSAAVREPRHVPWLALRGGSC
jgi:hypothetical protein